LSPAVTPPLAAPTGAAAPGAEAITAGAETGVDAGGAGMATTPESGGLWSTLRGYGSTIKGYADSPYGQLAIKEGMGMMKKPRSPFEPMQMQAPGLPALSPSPSIDRLAWMRAFNVQG